jgi:hypothetical protein
MSTGSTGSTNSLGSINDCREEPLLGSNDPAPSIWENYSNRLQARSLLINEESSDLPQVESNLNKSPQEEDLPVADVDYVEV